MCIEKEYEVWIFDFEIICILTVSFVSSLRKPIYSVLIGITVNNSTSLKSLRWSNICSGTRIEYSFKMWKVREHTLITLYHTQIFCSRGYWEMCTICFYACHDSCNIFLRIQQVVRHFTRVKSLCKVWTSGDSSRPSVRRGHKLLITGYSTLPLPPLLSAH